MNTVGANVHVISTVLLLRQSIALRGRLQHFILIFMWTLTWEGPQQDEDSWTRIGRLKCMTSFRNCHDELPSDATTASALSPAPAARWASFSSFILSRSLSHHDSLVDLPSVEPSPVTTLSSDPSIYRVSKYTPFPIETPVGRHNYVQAIVKSRRLISACAEKPMSEIQPPRNSTEKAKQIKIVFHSWPLSIKVMSLLFYICRFSLVLIQNRYMSLLLSGMLGQFKPCQTMTFHSRGECLAIKNWALQVRNKLWVEEG
jgi:hypothetical protein